MSDTQKPEQPVMLIATLPQAALVATSLTIEGLGWHRSPGSAKHFHGRSVFLQLPHDHGKPEFPFLDEGGWRDAAADTTEALKAALGGKKTKTALSNNALHCVPIDAARRCWLVKTSGRALEMNGPHELMRFTNHTCNEALTPNEVASCVGRPPIAAREPRFYMMLAPLEMLVLSNLTPCEYAWYATHRPGKVCRHLAFVEVASVAKRQLVAEGVLAEAMDELVKKGKKTKTLASGDLLNRVLFQDWIGYANPSEGGLYLADREHLMAWRFPTTVPSQWSRADG
ncbi:MAG: hypothetical protein HY901_26385 [Deltaproteobacteria bacterium]|nr:hypothetical protein [Deltaproteobacteria bacterium]